MQSIAYYGAYINRIDLIAKPGGGTDALGNYLDSDLMGYDTVIVIRLKRCGEGSCDSDSDSEDGCETTPKTPKDPKDPNAAAPAVACPLPIPSCDCSCDTLTHPESHFILAADLHYRAFRAGTQNRW